MNVNLGNSIEIAFILNRVFESQKEINKLKNAIEEMKKLSVDNNNMAEKIREMEENLFVIENSINEIEGLMVGDIDASMYEYLKSELKNKCNCKKLYKYGTKKD